MPAGYTMLLGGARSGKSSLAQRIASAQQLGVSLIATAERIDEDMSDRIDRHRAERPDDWTTIEEPVHVASAVARAGDDFVIVDCITVWLGNLLHYGWKHEAIMVAVDELADLLAERQSPSVVVSNEVGLGIHPSSSLGRAYRDLLGTANSRLAARSSASHFLVAGRILPLSSAESVIGGHGIGEA